MAAKKPAKEPAPATSKETKVGTVEHYYGKVQAAAVGLSADLKVGDTIHIKGATDDVTKKVTSMQMDHVPIQEGHKGQHVGVQIPTKVHDNSQVFKVGKPAAKAPAKKAARPKKAAKKPKKTAKKAKKAGKRKASTKRGGARKSAKKGKKAKRSAKAGRKGAKRGKKSAKRKGAKKAR